MLAALALLLFYNHARFGNLFDFGYFNQNVAASLREELTALGQFNVAYTPRNMWAMLVALPTLNAHGGGPAINSAGLTLLITTPALVYLVRAMRFDQHRWVIAGAWIALALTVGLLLLYYNTGASQFGYRFSLDFMPVALVLLACALPTISKLLRGLIVIGVLVNTYGVLWFARFAGT